MMSKQQIQQIRAREILDSRGNPTIEAVVLLSDGSAGRAAAPSGASTGTHELPELRDCDPSRYLGRGVSKAIAQVNDLIFPALCGRCVSSQQEIDQTLLSIQDEKNGRPLGSNSMLAVSLACARAAAMSYHLPLYRYLGGALCNLLPLPMMNLINGGAHACNNLDIQEFMVVPVGAGSFAQALEWCCRIYHRLREILIEQGLSVAVGDEGGFAPNLSGDEQALTLIMQAIDRAGFLPEEDFVLALDAAASGWVAPQSEDSALDQPRYLCPKSQRSYTTAELISYWESLCARYPIRSLEDPLEEHDWQGFVQLTHRLGSRTQIVGDDLFVTDSKRIREGIGMKAANAVLLKPNQVGTLTQTLEAARLAQRAGYRTILSHRSGETEDSIIADLAVACGAGQIKAGAPCRGERTAKYNQLLRIEEALGRQAQFSGRDFLLP